MMTRKQRCQINRRNAARSTGPRTTEGKNRSRQNALKHGLRAETILLPTEDLADVQRRFDDWDEHYGPDTPGERVLVHRAVYYSLQLDRCAVYQTALAAHQIRHALLDDEVRARTELDAVKALILTDPGAAVEGLHHTAAGCRWLIGNLDDMARVLRAGRFWDDGERALAVRLTGTDPRRPGIEESGLSRALGAHRALVDWGDVAAEENRAEWAVLRAELLRELEEEVAAIEPLEVQLQAIEARDRAEVVARALLAEGPKAALYLRYERMYELAFHRVYKEILKAIQVAEKAEKEGESDEDEGAEGAGEPGAPIEANGSPEGEISSSGAKTSEAASGHDLTVVAGGPVAASMASGEAGCSARGVDGPGGVSKG